MKVPGIWHKKPGKSLEFRTKNLEKTWNLVFGKKWEPWTVRKKKVTKAWYLVHPGHLGGGSNV